MTFYSIFNKKNLNVTFVHFLVRHLVSEVIILIPYIGNLNSYAVQSTTRTIKEAFIL